MALNYWDSGYRICSHAISFIGRLNFQGTYKYATPALDSLLIAFQLLKALMVFPFSTVSNLFVNCLYIDAIFIAISFVAAKLVDTYQSYEAVEKLYAFFSLLFKSEYKTDCEN